MLEVFPALATRARSSHGLVPQFQPASGLTWANYSIDNFPAVNFRWPSLMQPRLACNSGTLTNLGHQAPGL